MRKYLVMVLVIVIIFVLVVSCAYKQVDGYIVDGDIYGDLMPLGSGQYVMGSDNTTWKSLYVDKLYLKTDKTFLNESDVIDMQWLSPNGKPAIVWFDDSGNRQAAIVAHLWANDMSRKHQHWSVETSKLDGGLYTRFAIGWGDDKVPVKFSDCDIEFGSSTSAVFNGSLTSNTTTGIIVTSPSSAFITLNRAKVTDGGAIKFQTDGSLKWQLGTTSGGTTELFVIKNQGKGRDAIAIDSNNNVLLYAMDSDNNNAATVVAETVTANEPHFRMNIPVMPVMSGNYGSSWESILLPVGIEGRYITVHNTETGTDRMYVYINGTWRYSVLN